MAEHHTKVLIIGSGPAGCTAAIYAARANLGPLLVTGMEPGGQLTITTEVENYPGFADPIQGPWLMEQMQAQATNVGCQVLNDTITEVDFSTRPFRAVGDSGDVYLGETAVISTGASARWLGLEAETTFRGQGVSACATCDGFFYRGKDVAIVGGGNTAVEEAIFLTNFASKVTLIHRRDTLRAEKVLQERLFANPKVEILWDSVVDDILGETAPAAGPLGALPLGGGSPAGVTALRLKNVKSGEVSDLPVSGVFIAIGHSPNTGLFKGVLDMDDEGYLITAPDSTATNIPGVFAAGDVQDKTYRQAVTAAGTGCMAALEADRFLAAQAAGG